jgi:hypothetical protein
MQTLIGQIGKNQEACNTDNASDKLCLDFGVDRFGRIAAHAH